MSVSGYFVEVTRCDNDSKCRRVEDMLEVTIKLPLMSDQTYLVFEGTPAQWFTNVKYVIVGDNIRKSAALRIQQAQIVLSGSAKVKFPSSHSDSSTALQIGTEGWSFARQASS